MRRSAFSSLKSCRADWCLAGRQASEPNARCHDVQSGAEGRKAGLCVAAWHQARSSTATQSTGLNNLSHPCEFAPWIPQACCRARSSASSGLTTLCRCALWAGCQVDGWWPLVLLGHYCELPLLPRAALHIWRRVHADWPPQNASTPPAAPCQVCSWFAARCDLILLLFDPYKLDISDEFKSVRAH